MKSKRYPIKRRDIFVWLIFEMFVIYCVWLAISTKQDVYIYTIQALLSFILVFIVYLQTIFFEKQIKIAEIDKMPWWCYDTVDEL